MSQYAYLLFHLNLAFSSVAESRRPEIIAKCYWPMLKLARDHGMPIGVELTGWTLSEIARLDPTWVVEFRNLLQAGQCELIGSGWSQLIGPLVPYPVNQWNQKLGLRAYQEVLGTRPQLVLVNEMAYSDSMVDVYHEVGYQGFVMDRDNVRLALKIEDQPLSAVPTHGKGPAGAELPVLWGDSNLFQQLQRVVHGDKPAADYLRYVGDRARRDGQVIPLYCNDAEVFDFRPGRFHTEAAFSGVGEWTRLREVTQQALEAASLKLVLPSQALKASLAIHAHRASSLSSIAYPIPVKKQAKYNVNRWSITGRDDLWLNTQCHRLSKHLESLSTQDAEDWRELCELWASDLRTHITQERWDQAKARIEKWDLSKATCIPSAKSPGARPDQQLSSKSAWTIETDTSGLFLEVSSKLVKLRLNQRRGLTMDSLAFASNNFIPVIGTIGQGFFDSIALGADWYSGGAILEVPAERQRFTDLSQVKPTIITSDEEFSISAQLPFGSGTLTKTLTGNAAFESISLSYELTDVNRSLASLRLGLITLLNQNLHLPLKVSTKQGGKVRETFDVNQEATHAYAASALVSSSAGLSASDGNISIRDGMDKPLLRLQWDPSALAVMPLVTHIQSTPSPFTRIKFSLGEFDDTSKPNLANGTQKFCLSIYPE